MLGRVERIHSHFGPGLLTDRSYFGRHRTLPAAPTYGAGKARGGSVAGESAQNKAERLRRSADRYERGAQGEAATAHMLTELRPGNWTVLHDVAWPGRKLANIDHVAVGPPGVFVIDSKNWSGSITALDGVLLRNGRSQASTTRSAREAALAVGGLLESVNPEQVVPVLCFTGGDVPDRVLDGVLVCSIVTVVHKLTSRPSVFTDDEVQAVASELRRCLPAATEPRPAPGGKFTLGDRITMATPRSKPRAQKRRSPRTAVTVVAGLALAVGLATNPGAFLAVSNGVAELITDQMRPPADDPVQPKDNKVEKKHKAPVKKKNQTQR
jgi:hypothetical protein